VPTLSRRSPPPGDGVSADTNCCQCVLRAGAAPAAAIAYGLERRRWWLVRRAIAALAAGTALAIVAAAAVADVLDLTDRIPDAYASGVRPLTSFISHPDLLSAIVAGAAAVAGSAARARSAGDRQTLMG